MIKIVLASNNRKKISELETLFNCDSSNNVKLLSLNDIGFNDAIVENGDSFAENSIIKANVPAKMGYIGIADDSGLCVDFLNGAPGIYSARYSGADSDDAKNRVKLLREMNNVPSEKRGAKFVCAVSVVLPENSGITIPEKWRISEELSSKTGIPSERVMVVNGECSGFILTEERGNGGFGYDSLFYYPEFKASFAEIPIDKKNTVSHRGKAISEFTEKLMTIIK